MKLLSPLVWHEGMHLSQHHFQSQNRYFEDLTSFVLSQLSPGPWGLLELEIDEEALSNGTAALVHGRGILPDGTSFHFPHDPPPPPIPVTEGFSPTQDAHELFLILPTFRPDRANCDLGEGAGGELRYTSEDRPILDQVSGSGERQVRFARKNFRLCLDHAVPEGAVSLPLARIRRDGKGQFKVDPAFVAPALRIGGSQPLVALLSRLVGMLEAKATSLAEDRKGGTPGAGAGELAGFWLAHAIHSALPSLRHMLLTRGAHPEELYRELSRLAGALCTFSLETDARSLPVYDHAHPDRAFGVLDAHIRRYLDVVLPAGALAVPLLPARPSGEGKDETLSPDRQLSGAETTFHMGEIQDTRVFGKAEWYLGIRSSKPLAAVAGKVPEVMKICAARFVARLVREALPGIGMEHVAVPPDALGMHGDMQVFRLVRTEPCWTAMARTGEVGIYVPASIPDAELSLKVLLDG